MKKRIKPSWKELTRLEKAGVITIYILGIMSMFAILMVAYLTVPIVW